MSDCGDLGDGGQHGCCDSPDDLGGCGGYSATADSPATNSPQPHAPSSLLTTSPSSPIPHQDRYCDSSSPSPSSHASVARHVPSRSDGLLRRSTRSPPLSLAHHHHHHQHHHQHHTDSDPDDPDLHHRTLHSVGLSDTEGDSELSPPAHVRYKDEPLSVSVVPEDSPLDTHDSGLLSPADLSPREGPVSVPSMIDATDFRSLQPEPIYQNLSSMNGRMSPPGFSPSSASSYATLTPLQPLPPISTVSDKFAYGHGGNVSGSFTVMQNNGLGNMLSMGSPYQYDKLSMSPPHYTSNNGLGISLGPQHSPLSPHSYHNGLSSPQKSLSPNGYDSPYTRQDMSRTTLSGSTHSPTLSSPATLHHSPLQQNFSAFTVAPTPTLTTSSLNMNGLCSLSPQNVSPHSPNYSPQLHGAPSPSNIKQEAHLHGGTIGCQLVNINAPMSMSMNQSPPHAHMSVSMPQQISGIPTSIGTISTSCGGQMKQSSMATTSGGNLSGLGPVGGVGGGEVEEINTKELAQRISAELKRYSIPQAIFAQRVLCRSQGTLSDLLRNPKPWSKLKSGRETFRRMWKWLQEPEFQRMSALRLAVKNFDPNYNIDLLPSPAGNVVSPSLGKNKLKEVCIFDPVSNWNPGGNCTSFIPDRISKDLSCSQAGFQVMKDDNQLNYQTDCQSRNPRVEPGKRVSSSTSSSSSTPVSSSSPSTSSSSLSSFSLTASSSLSSSNVRRPSLLTPSSASSLSRSYPSPHHNPHHHPNHPYHPSYAYPSHYQTQTHAHGGQAHGLTHGHPQTQGYGATYLGSSPAHHHHFAQPSSSPIFSPYNRYLQAERGATKSSRTTACAQEAAAGLHGFAATYPASYF